MVLCASYNLRAHSTIHLPHDAGEGCRYELTTSVPSNYVASKPISLRSPCGTVVDGSGVSPPMERLYSPLSSSADSIGSIKSSSSSRSSAEREIERQQRRQLLDASLLKIRASNNNMPLRKHLLVCNIVKQLQRDLDLLDDEELYCNLMDESYGERMDVDERRWPFGGVTTSTTTSSATSPPACAVSIPVIAQVAPPQQEERRVAEDSTSLISSDLNMNVSNMVQQQQNQQPHQTTSPLEMWSWAGETTIKRDDRRTTSNSNHYEPLFETIQDAVDDDSSFVAWSWTLTADSNINAGTHWWTERTRTTSFGDEASRFEPIWGRMGADLLGTTNLSRFELQHLFPSQVLLQA